MTVPDSGWSVNVRLCVIVFGEDVTKHGIPRELLLKVELLIVSDILPSLTTVAAHYLNGPLLRAGRCEALPS